MTRLYRAHDFLLHSRTGPFASSGLSALGRLCRRPRRHVPVSEREAEDVDRIDLNDDKNELPTIHFPTRCVTPFRLPLQPPAPSPSGAGTIGAGQWTATTRRRRSLRLQQLQKHEQEQQEQPQQGNETASRYLNVNLVYELWKDIDISFLKVSHPHPAVHLTRLVALWSLLNLPFAALLFPLSGLRFKA
jgi:hypothetical protein